MLRWRRLHKYSPPAILALHFLAGREHARRPWPARAQTLYLAQELPPGLAFGGSDNVFFKQRDDFPGDRLAVLSSSIAKRLVQLIGDILNVKGCHMFILVIV